MGEPLTIQISAEAVAWYGAIIATVSILVSAYSVWRDRARIDVEVNRNVIGFPPNTKDFVSITVINKGRRPIILPRISSVGFALKGGNALLSTDPINDPINKFPIRIEEGNSTEIYIVEEAVLKYKNDLLYAFAKDATGKVYKCKKIKHIKK